MSTVTTKGTYADRIALVQLQVTNSPVHSLPLLRTLVEQLAQKGVRESNKTLTVLRDVFVEELLPPKRKLVGMAERPTLVVGDESSKKGLSAEGESSPLSTITTPIGSINGFQPC